MRLVLKIYDTTEYPKNCKTEQDVLDLFDSLPIFTDMILAKEELKNNEIVRFEDCLFFNLTRSGYFDKLNIVDVDENTHTIMQSNIAQSYLKKFQEETLFSFFDHHNYS